MSGTMVHRSEFYIIQDKTVPLGLLSVVARRPQHECYAQVMALAAYGVLGVQADKYQHKCTFELLIDYLVQRSAL